MSRLRPIIGLATAAMLILSTGAHSLAGYLLFGSWAFVMRNFEPFFLVFLVPGAMLVFAGWPGEPQS